MLKLKFKFRETRKFQNFTNFCFLGLDGDDARDIPSWRTRDQRGCIRVSERSDAAPVLSWKAAKALEILPDTYPYPPTSIRAIEAATTTMNDCKDDSAMLVYESASGRRPTRR